MPRNSIVLRRRRANSHCDGEDHARPHRDGGVFKYAHAADNHTSDLCLSGSTCLPLIAKRIPTVQCR